MKEIQICQEKLMHSTIQTRFKILFHKNDWTNWWYHMAGLICCSASTERNWSETKVNHSKFDRKKKIRKGGSKQWIDLDAQISKSQFLSHVFEFAEQALITCQLSSNRSIRLRAVNFFSIFELLHIVSMIVLTFEPGQYHLVRTFQHGFVSRRNPHWRCADFVPSRRMPN